MKRLVICLLGGLFTLSVACGQKSGTFTYPTNKNVVRIAIQAPDPNTNLVLKQAFRLHGGLQPVSQPSAASPNNNRIISVRLIFISGHCS